jgi:SpoVK/Ycf46/Vps4 family AAA+-type ATPase
MLPTENVFRVGRDDLIAEYIGQSEAKVRRVLTQALGGVLFIDEAQSMGQAIRPDSYSQAMADVITKFLVEHKSQIALQIAGYENDIRERFLSLNKGLERRFTETIHLEGYTTAELYEMFRRRLERSGWKVDPKIDGASIIAKNKDLFEFHGGDVETFIGKCKREYAQRIFGSRDAKRTITKADFINGMTAHRVSKRKDGSRKRTYTETMMYM